MIVRTIRLVAPFFEDFAIKPLALNEDKIRLEWRHRGSDAYFDASSLSDGSLRFIALATLLLQPAELQLRAGGCTRSPIASIAGRSLNGSTPTGWPSGCATTALASSGRRTSSAVGPPVKAVGRDSTG